MDLVGPSPAGRVLMLNRLLAVLASLLVGLTILIVFVGNRLLDSDTFGETVGQGIAEPAVSGYLAGELSSAVVEQVPAAALGGTLIENTFRTSLESDVARSAVEGSASQLHKRVFDQETNNLIVSSADFMILVKTKVALVDSDLADSLPGSDIAVTISDSPVFTVGPRVAQLVGRLKWAIIIATLVSLYLVWRSGGRALEGLSHAGSSIAAGGGLIVVVYSVGAVGVGRLVADPTGTAMVHAIYRLIFGRLLLVGSIVFLVGLLLRLGVSNTAGQNIPTAMWQAVSRVPDSRASRILRLVGIALAAFLAVRFPAEMSRLVVSLAGLVGLGIVISGLFDETGFADRLRRMIPDSGEETVDA